MSTSITHQQLVALAGEHGAPLYVYDAEVMRRQYRKMEEAFKECNVRIHYAAKALTNLHVLRLFKEMGAGLDAVSVEEVKIRLMAGFKPEEILYTPNCVSFSEIETCVELGVKLNIDNISILEQFGNKYGAAVPVCIQC